MTNKEKYKQAFSVLHPSGAISLEVDHMMLKNKKARFRAAAAATAVCLLFAGGGSMAYAADLGGIQRTVQLWIDGDRTNATIEFDADGRLIVHIPKEDGTAEEMGSGGIAIEDDGKERPLTESELLNQLNDPNVEYKEDGTVWVYYYDQKIDITDKFEDGVCYVKVSNGEETLYMTVKYQDGWCASPHKYQSPDSFN